MSLLAARVDMYGHGRSKRGGRTREQVYVSGQCDFGAVRERVLGYVRRECASADPIVTIMAVPRLPKDGHIS